jgi:hypothetical protein
MIIRTKSAPNEVVLLNNNKSPEMTSMIPRKVDYVVEYPIKAHNKPSG